MRNNLAWLLSCVFLTGAGIHCSDGESSDSDSDNAGGSGGGIDADAGAGGSSDGGAAGAAGENVCPEPTSSTYTDSDGNLVVSRAEYQEKLEGFWLAQSIANQTGLITEMDKDGSTMERGLPFYTDETWGTMDPIVLWGDPKVVDFVFVTGAEGTWSADDDTDIEYIYLHLLHTLQTSMLTPVQIRDGWLAHIWDESQETPFGLDYKGDYENWLWVSNQTAHTLMVVQNMVPPDTSDPANNPEYLMIDAQLTTEIFGTFAPARWDVALDMAYLPIRTTAREDAAWISEFYVIMHSLASRVDPGLTMEEKVMWLADQARKRLPDDSFSARMYDYVLAEFQAQPDDWAATRDAIYFRYQEHDNDGYDFNFGFDAGINFAASLVSLFYGRGDLPRTVQIGTLAGWDSDNPTSTWGGLLGFMLGAEGVKCAFDQPDLSEHFWISRSRKNLPDRTPDHHGEDTFTMMAQRGVEVADRAVTEEMGGTVDLENDVWVIPIGDLAIVPGTPLSQ